MNREPQINDEDLLALKVGTYAIVIIPFIIGIIIGVLIA